MRVETLSRSRRCKNYEPHEDTTICRMVADNRLIDDIATVLDRSPASVGQRIDRLRKLGTIPGYSPRRKVLEVERAVTMVPPITLRCDDDLIRYTLREGGFPRAVPTSVGTVWAGPDGMPWRHGRSVEVAA